MKYYLVYGKKFGSNIDYEVFDLKEDVDKRAREIDKTIATEWIVICGNFAGFGIDDSISWPIDN
jgi:hypothetical protein